MNKKINQSVTNVDDVHSLKKHIDADFLYNALENLKMLAEIESQYTIADALTSIGCF